LRVYSDDMRHKRLSRAEEKAYSLPAKLSLPMMVCIFPVLFVVILLPVFVRLYTGHTDLATLAACQISFTRRRFAASTSPSSGSGKKAGEEILTILA
jgi:pilus assembly protein TadC